MASPNPSNFAQKELAARELARRRLLFFTKKTHPTYEAGWVHEDICARLERFSRQVQNRESPRLMLLMPPRHGKACALGTPVPTPGGFVPIERLRPGDLVFGRDGNPTAVTAVSPIWRDRELFEVTSDDGASVVVDAEHDWTVRLCHNRPVYKPKATKHLASRVGKRRPAIQTHEAARYAARALPVPPYVLGAWLGDGTSRNATMTQGSQDYAWMRAEIEREGVSTSDRATAGTFGLLGIHRHLPLNDKHIPAEYLCASVEQRMALLQGLIDTDGYVAPDGQVEFCSVNERLARDTLQLVRSLGVKASLILGSAMLNGKSHGPKYRVMFYMAGAARLPRKAALCRNAARTPHRFLSFTPVGRGDTVCIQVAAPDHQYLVGEGYLLTHNSELASIRFPAWHLGHAPNHEIINVGYNLDLPMRFSRKVREVVREPFYEKLFPETRLDPESSSAENWNTTAGGGFQAAGVGGGITGKGAHVAIVDDPIKNQVEADSVAVRDNLWDWYMSTLKTRLSPGGGVLIIETWWNDDDLAGRVQQLGKINPLADQFEIIKYPAISTDWEFRHSETMDIYHASTPLDMALQSNALGLEVVDLELLRTPNQALHPDRYDLRALQSIKANTTERIWSALYQQNPVPDEGMFFKQEYFKFVPDAPEPRDMHIYTSWDFAIGQKTYNDWTVGVTIGQDHRDNLYVLEVIRFKGDSLQIVDAIGDVVSRFGTIPGCTYMVGFEDGQIFRSLQPYILKRFTERRLYPIMELMKPLTDKMSRAGPLQGRMQQGKVFFPDSAAWKNPVISEMLRFPAGAHDDCVDAMAWTVQLISRRPPPAAPEAQQLPSWRDNLHEGADMYGYSHMAA